MQWEWVESCTICLKTNKQKLYRTKFDKIAFNDDITETKVIAGSEPSIIVRHLTKMFIFFFCLPTLYLMYYGGLYFVYWIRKRCRRSRSQDKILMKSIKIRIFYIFLSKTSHIASIDIDLPHWQKGHCRALYYLMLTGYHFSASYWCQSPDWEVMSWYRRPSPPLSSGHPLPTMWCHKVFVTSHRREMSQDEKLKVSNWIQTQRPLGNLLAHILQ